MDVRPRIAVFQARPALFSWLLFLAYAVLLISRDTSLLTDPRFWAEEGAIYFSHAFHHGFAEQLSFMAAGYYSFINVFSTALASLVPLAFAPLVTTGIALAIQLIPAALIVFAKIRVFENRHIKIIALLVLLLVLPNREVWLNVINSQFYLAVAVGLLLVCRSESRLQAVSYTGILMLAGFSGVVSLFLFPLFLLRAVIERDREKWLQSLLLLLIGLVQAYLILSSSTGLRQGEIDLVAMVMAFIVKTLLLPLLGYGLTDVPAQWFAAIHQQHGLPAFLAMLSFFLLAWFAYRFFRAQIRTDSYYLLAAAALLFGLSFYGALGNNAGLIGASSGERYFTAPNILFYLALVSMFVIRAREPSGPVMAAGMLLFLLVFTGVVHFWQHPSAAMAGPSWQQQIKNSEDEHRRVNIWPYGWFVNLNREDNRALSGCRFSQFLTDDVLCLHFSDQALKVKLLFHAKVKRSDRFSLVNIHVLENRNPSALPGEVIFRQLPVKGSSEKKDVRLKIRLGGEFFAAERM